MFKIIYYVFHRNRAEKSYEAYRKAAKKEKLRPYKIHATTDAISSVLLEKGN